MRSGVPVKFPLAPPLDAKMLIKATTMAASVQSILCADYSTEILLPLLFAPLRLHQTSMSVPIRAHE